MITRFHAAGASAGTAKCSNELSIPTTSPDSASSTTIGNIRRARFTVRSASAGSSSKPGAITLISGSASRMNSAVTAPRIRRIRKKRLEATRNASLRSPFSSSSLNTGTNAPWSAESANSARTRFGTWKAIVNADIAPVTPKYLAATTSRASPSRRERPVATEKNAVLRAMRRACPDRPGACSGRPGASVATGRRPLHFRLAAPQFEVRRQCVYGQHRLTRKADSSGGARAPRESAPYIPGEDLVPPPGIGGQRGRRHEGRRGVSPPRLADRQGCEVGRAAPQQRRPQEVARGAHPQPPHLDGLETELLIRGERVSGDGDSLAVENPATEERLASVGLPSSEQLDAAVVAANEAFPAWAATPAVERAELLHEVAIRLRARTDELARVMTLEGGKPLIEDSDEVGWTASAFDYYAEMGRNFAGRVIPSIESTQLALVVKEPIGAWGCIVPWNYPLLLLAWKLAPAIAAGNTVVAKPSELTPLSTLMLAGCFEHLPPGAVNIVVGGGDVGSAIVNDERIAGVAFTGSVATGKRVAGLCAERVARVNLEMGGKDPFIVCSDVARDVRVAARGGAWAAYLNAGQVCTSAERFYVA